MRTLLSLLLILLPLASSSLSTPLEDTNSLEADKTCLYKITVKTGNLSGAGTNAVVSLTLAGAHRPSGNLTIANLKTWGAMEPGHDYFKRGNVDIFIGTHPCLAEEICWMFLSHDNSGYEPGWYVEYVELNIGGGLGYVTFRVNQWLSLSEPPYQLFAERSLDICNKGGQGEEDQIIILNSQA